MPADLCWRLRRGHRHDTTTYPREASPYVAPVRCESRAGISSGRSAHGVSGRGCSSHFVFWGDPSSLVQRAKAGGAIVMHTVGSAADAKRAVSCGVDIVVAQGWEAGGHSAERWRRCRSYPLSWTLFCPTPVVAAGGIADGRGLAALWLSAPPVLGLEPASLAAMKPPSIPDITSAFCRRTRTTRFTRRTCLMSVGRTHPIASLEIKPSRSGSGGRPPSGKRPGEGEVIATSRRAARLFVISLTRLVVMLKAILMPCPLWAGQASACVEVAVGRRHRP